LSTLIDLHVHTHLSPCGKPAATVEAMIERAQQKGIVALGFADHITPQPVPGCPFYDRQRIDVVDGLRAELAQLPSPPAIEILVGIEADYTMAGQGCLDAQTLDRVDHVICAASHFHLPGAPQPESDAPRHQAELMLRMAREALRLPGVDVWAHPFDCSKMRPLLPIVQTMREEELEDLIRLANDREIAIEINGGPGQHAAYREATTPFFQLAYRLDAGFTITSDAHHPQDLDRLDLAMDWAKEMGLAGNLLTLDQIRDRQRRRI
jgi:histidinol phosphatase-like PHP family hydrolase